MGVYFLTLDKNDCCGCGGCVNICPKDAIGMEADEYGFVYPRIDGQKCVDCRLCHKICAQVGENNSAMPLKALAGSHKNKDALLKSSSGGVFYALAEHIIEIGGVVCGCIMDENLKVMHICADNAEDCLKIRKSKYVQSDMGLVYRQVKKLLSQGKQVLFTGTPCQIAALYAVVGRKYENLTTMDLICHGVPSQLLFDKFIQYLEGRYKTRILAFDFRSKKFGWKRFSMEFTDENRRTVNIGKAREFFIPAFTGGNIIRPNCLSCKYASPNRIGDITIGDFWGYEKVKLQCDTAYGTSVFTINTENGEKWLTVLQEKLVCQEIDYDIAVSRNTCLHKPTPKGKKREQYLRAIRDDKIPEIAQQYRQRNLKKRIGERVRHAMPIPVFQFLHNLTTK